MYASALKSFHFFKYRWSKISIIMKLRQLKKQNESTGKSFQLKFLVHGAQCTEFYLMGSGTEQAQPLCNCSWAKIYSWNPQPINALELEIHTYINIYFFYPMAKSGRRPQNLAIRPISQSKLHKAPHIIAQQWFDKVGHPWWAQNYIIHHNDEDIDSF